MTPITAEYDRNSDVMTVWEDLMLKRPLIMVTLLFFLIVFHDVASQPCTLAQPLHIYIVYASALSTRRHEDTHT